MLLQINYWKEVVYMAYRIVPFLVTLTDLQRHSSTASLFKCDCSYSLEAVDNIWTDFQSQPVPLR